MMGTPIRLALVGLGRASEARRRACAEQPALAACVATVSRRPGAGSHSWAAVLADASIDAICIATENASHARLAAEALEAGKHVLVDFPLATSAAEAEALLQKADAVGRVLHTESIGLLTAEHNALRSLHQADPLLSLELEFAAGLEGWVLGEALAGRLGNLGVGRLQALWDVFGPLALHGAFGLVLPGPGSAAGAGATPAGDAGPTPPFGPGYRVDAVFSATDGRTRVHWAETRRPGLQRSRTLQGTHTSGRPLALGPIAEPGGLFAADLAHFVARIRGAGSGYVSNEAIVGVLQLADAIDAACASAGEPAA